ncbi:MAG: HAMP domain-containing histidine kinase [Lewinellaceae bacterium]|nr:HAMP domain-containing histidine kinase [Lewinellaceae bacterium]
MLINKISLRGLTTVVLVYMVFAFGWWAVQLWRENDRVFKLSEELLERKYGGPNRGINLTELRATAEYKELIDRQEKHQRMIFAEGVFFTLCLGFGLYVINRAAKREVVLARQRRNFLLSITHELKSPIASLRLTMETLSRRTLNRDQMETLCSNGLRDATRLQNLVEDLLLAARLEDNWSPHPEPVDLLQIAQDCVINLKTRFPKTNFNLDIPDAFSTILADKSGMTAVVQNLLENAVKYSPSGTPVQLSVRQIQGKTQLVVSDKGVGIPNSEKLAIFDKFYRIGNEETRQTTGTGLGLYIVKQVVEAHHGKITVTDNRPAGSIFTVEI